MKPHEPELLHIHQYSGPLRSHQNHLLSSTYSSLGFLYPDSPKSSKFLPLISSKDLRTHGQVIAMTPLLWHQLSLLVTFIVSMTKELTETT
jgi:hypothetical protein